MVAQPAVVGHAMVVTGGAAGGKAPLEFTEKDDRPPAEEVPVMGAAEPVQGDEVVAEDGEGDNDGTEEEEERNKWLKHYSSMQSILLVGDGDFSFSLALATAFGSGANLVATSLDTYEDLKAKYSKAESNIAMLKRLGTRILHGVNANMMRLHTELKSRRFDRVVFNFPHAGFIGREDDVHVIIKHMELVSSFFHNAIHMLRPSGEIHVSHKMGQPYDSWNLECLAAAASLVMFEKVCFRKEDYPGYNQKRGSGPRCDEPFRLGPCCTLKFQIGDLKKHKKQNQIRVGDPVSLIGGHNTGAENLANNIRPFHQPPLVQPWHWSYFPPVVNTVHMLTAPHHCVVSQRQQTGFSLKFSNHQGTVHPMLRMPGPSPSGLPAPGCIPPAIDSITHPHLATQEQPWYMERTIAGSPGRENCPYFDHQLRLQREEQEMQRKVMRPGLRGLIRSSAFLEDRRREYVRKQELLALEDVAMR